MERKMVQNGGTKHFLSVHPSSQFARAARFIFTFAFKRFRQSRGNRRHNSKKHDVDFLYISFNLAEWNGAMRVTGDTSCWPAVRPTLID
jgi:hypothetical protein